MCISGPKIPANPATPERQDVKQPTTDARGDSLDENSRRRRGMMATILTSSQGALAPVATTADAAGGKAKLG